MKGNSRGSRPLRVTDVGCSDFACTDFSSGLVLAGRPVPSRFMPGTSFWCGSASQMYQRRLTSRPRTVERIMSSMLCRPPSMTMFRSASPRPLTASAQAEYLASANDPPGHDTLAWDVRRAPHDRVTSGGRKGRKRTMPEGLNDREMKAELQALRKRLEKMES